MKAKYEMDKAESSFVYKRARKKYLANLCKIRCGFCRYHKGENATYRKRESK